MGEHQKVFNALFHQPAQMRRFFLPLIPVLLINMMINLVFFLRLSGCPVAVSLTI